MKKRFLFLAFLLFLIPVNAEEIDIKTEIIEKEIAPDDPLRFQVSIFRLGEKREDLYLEYFIENNNQLKFIKSESLAVEKIASFFRSIELPSTIRKGSSTLIVKASIRGIESSSTETFSILKPQGYVNLPIRYINYLFIFLAILLVIFIIYLIQDYKLTSKIIKDNIKIDAQDLR